MVDDRENLDPEDKKEDSFEFDSAGEAVGYISMAQARVVAMRTAGEEPGNYGAGFKGIQMVFEVAGAEQDSEEEGGLFHIWLSYRPEGTFQGQSGVEEFILTDVGEIEIRQVLSWPAGESVTPMDSETKIPPDPADSRPSYIAGWRHALGSLANRDFALLWMGTNFAVTAGQMNQVARGFLVYQLTDSPQLLSAVVVAEVAPLLVLSLLGGTIADRLDRKALVIVGQMVLGLNGVFIAVSVATDTITWQHLLATALVQGVAWALTIPARHALVPQIVGQRMIGNAVALAGAGMSGSILIGPVIGGALYGWFGPGGVYSVIAGMSVVAVMFTMLVKRPAVDAAPVKSPMLSEIASGLAYIWHDRLVQVMLLVALAVSLLTTPLRALLPVLVVDVLHRDAQSLGLLVSAAGGGALAGSLAIASLGRKGRGLMFLMAGIFSGIALVVVAMLTSYVAAVAVLAIFGLGEAGHRVLTQGLIMEHAEDRFRGRLMSVNEMRLGIAFLGVLPAGLAVDRFGIEGTLAVLGVAAIVASVLALATQGWLRRLQ